MVAAAVPVVELDAAPVDAVVDVFDDVLEVLTGEETPVCAVLVFEVVLFEPLAGEDKFV